jgi:hypothetical protein
MALKNCRECVYAEPAEGIVGDAIKCTASYTGNLIIGSQCGEIKMDCNDYAPNELEKARIDFTCACIDIARLHSVY